MIRRGHAAPALFALILAASSAHAQGASFAAGVATAAGDLANTAGAGYDLDLQVRTDRMLGPLGLRIDATYSHLSGKGGASSIQFSSQTVGLVSDFGGMFFWTAGPGYYQSNSKSQLFGHTIVDQRSYLGAQFAVGMNVKLFRWDTFVELGAVKLFGGAANNLYLPLRFGFRL